MHQPENRIGAGGKILKLSDICTILYKSTSPFISLADEVEIIEYHLKLEQLRYTQRLNVVLRRK